MELRHLRYLVAIADAGSFSRAAETLRVAQPALTRQIHDLEKELEAELFDPAARKATPTETGDACIRLARHVIQDTEAAVRRARMSNVGVVGRCVVMSGPIPLRTGIVPKLVARIKSRYPGISLDIQEAYAARQLAQLEDGTADIGLTAVPPREMKMLQWETQYVHAFDHILVAPEHPLARVERITLDELSKHTFLTIDEGGPDFDKVQQEILAEFEKLGRTPERRVFSSFESAQAHVRAGQGWAPILSLMATKLPPLVGRKIEDFSAPFRTVRIWRAADKRPVIHTVIRELRELQIEEREPMAPSRDAVKLEPHEEFVPARLELRHLRSFVHVARDGSFGLAAENIGITQPALSRQMKDLEFDVGAPLFERGTRGVDLTAAGSVFLADVESVLSVVDHLPKEVHRAERAIEQRCVVGAVAHPWVDKIVVSAIADLENRHVRVRVGTRAVATPQIASALKTAEIDVGIGHVMPGPVTPGFIRERLFHDEICGVLIAQDHPYGREPSLFLKDLENVPFVFPARAFFAGMYDAVWRQFQLAAFQPRIEGEYDGLQTIWALVSQGFGWTLAWRGLMDEPPEGLKALKLHDLHIPFGAEIVYRQDESRAPILTAIDAIQDCARQLFPILPQARFDVTPPRAPSLPIQSDTRKAAIS